MSCVEDKPKQKRVCRKVTYSQKRYRNDTDTCDDYPSKHVLPCRYTVDGQCCHIPFIYQNNLYEGCIMNNGGKRWCALTNNYDKDGLYGECQMPPDCIRVTGGNDPGKCCYFPFKYNDDTYINCDDVNNNGVKWCATTENYDKDQKWGNCVLHNQGDQPIQLT